MNSKTPNSPYSYPYPPTVDLIPIYEYNEPTNDDIYVFLPTNKRTINNIQLTDNFKLSELVQASYVTPEELENFETLPIDMRVISGAQLFRETLGKPIKINSSFRSENYELSKGRNGKSQHTLGRALDISGVGLVSLVKEAVQTKNDLYKRLRALGINSFGIYTKDNFIHIDTRENKPNNEPYLWVGDNDKPKKTGETKTILFFVFTLFLVPFGFKLLRK